MKPIGAIGYGGLLVALASCAGASSATSAGADAGQGGTSNSGGSGGGASTIVTGAAGVQSSAAGSAGGELDGASGSGGMSALGGSAGADTTAGTGGGASAGASGSGGAAAGGMGGAPEVGGASGASGAGGNTGGSPYPYIFSCFNDAAPLSSLMIYTSKDALNWTLLYDTKFTGPTGFMRDPSIMRHTDGKYYIAFTTPPTLSCCGSEQSFAIASSSNLKDWTTVAQVPSGVAGTVNTWAPEWFIDSDGSVHVTVTLDLKTYRYEPTDATLTKWGPGKFIGLSGTIDTQIVKIDGTYHAIMPSRHGTSASLDGPWTIGSNAPKCKEAPATVHITGKTWRYYCDDGGNGHEKSALTTDQFQTFSALQTLPVVGNDISHGTVIRGDTGHPY